MADNVAITAGTGTDISTDDAGAGGHVQRVKLTYSADGSAVHIPADADGLLVNLGANNDISGTVTANLAAGTNNIGDVDVLTVNGVAPAFGTGARGATVQRVTVATDDVVPVSGTVAVTQSGAWDEVGINDSGNSITVDWAGVAPPIGAGTEAAALRVTLATNSTGVVSIDDNGGIITVDGTVTVGSITAGDSNIGNVDIVTMPNVTLAAGTNTNEVVGDVAHSIAVAGNPIVIAGSSQDTDDTAPPNRVDAEGDATRLATDRDGSLFVRTHGPQVWTYHVNGSAALTDATVHASPGAGLSLYVGTITFSSGAATAINMFLEEGASTVIGPYYLEATAGRGMSVTFNPPRKITAATALTITTSAAIAHSVDITGFTAQG